MKQVPSPGVAAAPRVDVERARADPEVDLRANLEVNQGASPYAERVSPSPDAERVSPSPDAERVRASPDAGRASQSPDAERASPSPDVERVSPSQGANLDASKA